MGAARNKLNALANTPVHYSREIRVPRDPDSWGLEIEVEEEAPRRGRRAQDNNSVFERLSGELDGQIRGWTVTTDGSLRRGAELVSDGPQRYADLRENLDRIDAGFKAIGFVPSYSIRTSVHVHMNVCHLTMRDILNVLVIHTLLENSMVAMAGEERKGNLHCLLLTEAQNHVQRIRQMYSATDATDFRGSYLNLIRGNARYAAVNLMSLNRFGTLEFRLHRGTHDTNQLMNWIDTLRRIRDKAQTFEDPRDIVKWAKNQPAELLELVPDNYRRDIGRSQMLTARELAFSRLNWQCKRYSANGAQEEQAAGEDPMDAALRAYNQVRAARGQGLGFRPIAGWIHDVQMDQQAAARYRPQQRPAPRG